MLRMLLTCPLTVFSLMTRVWAMRVSQLPIWEMPWPMKKSRKFRIRNDANVSRAAAAKTGTQMVAIGKLYFSAGDYANAVDAIQKGLAKGGVADADFGVRLSCRPGLALRITKLD